MGERPVGLTRDAGWEVGVSRSFAASPEVVWELVTSPEGIAIWLGPGVASLAPGEAYDTRDGTTGEVRSVRALDRVRLTWRPRERAEPATLQFAIQPKERGCALRFHAERLADADEREAMRTRFRGVLDALAARLPDG